MYVYHVMLCYYVNINHIDAWWKVKKPNWTAAPKALSWAMKEVEKILNAPIRKLLNHNKLEMFCSLSAETSITVLTNSTFPYLLTNIYTLCDMVADCLSTRSEKQTVRVQVKPKTLSKFFTHLLNAINWPSRRLPRDSGNFKNMHKIITIKIIVGLTHTAGPVLNS